MSRWAALPAELDPRVRQLVVRLRRLKDHSGLSLRRLGARTGYSAKSWERYLGGRSLPPREAVEALARIGGEDPTRLLALHEVAAEVWARRRDAGVIRSAGPGGRGVVSTADADTSVPEPAAAEPEILSAGGNGRWSPGGWLLVALVAGAVALVLAVSAAVLLVVRLGGGAGEGAAAPVAGPGTAATPDASASAYSCRVERVGGRWFAGHSRTRDAILTHGHAGPEVAEAQCLLRRAGVSPGDIDGIFGPLTERAVRRMQQRSGLVVDGIVGPHTWKALRR
ncbi:peptidoglycan-binding protein [Streptomyces sp. NPDC051243]|uniref:peptidoglycan-binding protein n=1 Tax=Streptomyces sp. NPDC051243 TaxID=3365646 RepID=UPI0037990148